MRNPSLPGVSAYARAELGQGGNFTAILKKAWASDPDLRGQFGDAVSAGLRKMWANAAVRAEQEGRLSLSGGQRVDGRQGKRQPPESLRLIAENCLAMAARYQPPLGRRPTVR
jgi:hypothetical protein